MNSIKTKLTETKNKFFSISRNDGELSEEEAVKIRTLIAKTFSLIEHGKSSLSKNLNERVVLVIGQTGVGKSTLINYLSGARLTAVDDYGDFILHVENQVGEIEIGHEATSKTTVPNKWHDQINDIIYWDCPGFEDTKGAEQDIANAFYIQRLFHNAFLKILIVVQHTTLKEKRGSAFSHLIGKLGALLKDFDHFKTAIALVVSKTPEEATKDNVRKTIHGIVDKASGSLNDVQISIMKFLLENPQRIEIFGSPTQAGVIGDEQKNKILNMIKNVAKEVSKSDVNITVSDTSLLVSDEISKEFVNSGSRIYILKKYQRSFKKKYNTSLL